VSHGAVRLILDECIIGSTHRVGWAGTLGSERLTVREHRNRLAHDAQGRRGELFVRGVFDLGVRRKPQAFAADAVDLWILSPNLLIINELTICASPKPGLMAQVGVKIPVGSPAKPEITQKNRLCPGFRQSIQYSKSQVILGWQA
jgi:hypothetical protein